MRKIFEINNFETNVHVYSTKLIFGDAHHLIEKMKTDDAYFNHFYDDDKDEYINSIDKLSPLKTYEFISFPSSGGCWTPIYSSQAKNKNVDAFFIETAATEIDSTPANSKLKGSKEHLKLINEMIANSIPQKSVMPTDKPFGKIDWNSGLELLIESGKVLFMEADQEVKFTPKEKDYKIDYKQKTEKIFEELYNITWEPKFKFINFGTPEDSYTNDFHADYVSTSEQAPRVSTHYLFKVFAKHKDFDWFNNYFWTYYFDGTRDEKTKKLCKDWVKDYIDSYGYVLGYYIANVKMLDD